MTDHYQGALALRLANPLNVLARFSRLRRGDDDTLAAFLQREYGPLLGTCDVEEVVTSIEEDAAEITAILGEYKQVDCTNGNGDDGDHCPVCSPFFGPCRERFENDAADVAMEANEPFLPVLMWMHDNDLSSLTDGITSMAELYVKNLNDAHAAETLERLVLGRG